MPFDSEVNSACFGVGGIFGLDFWGFGGSGGFVLGACFGFMVV